MSRYIPQRNDKGWKYVGDPFQKRLRAGRKPRLPNRKLEVFLPMVFSWHHDENRLVCSGTLGDIFRILLSEMNHFIAILFSLLIALHAYINSCCCFNFKNSFPVAWHAERLKAFWFCGCGSKPYLLYSYMQHALRTVVYFTI